MHPTGSVQSSAHSLSLCSFATKMDTQLGSLISLIFLYFGINILNFNVVLIDVKELHSIKDISKKQNMCE